MKMIHYLEGIFFILFGTYPIFCRYRVILGGTKYVATVKRYDSRKRLRGGNWYDLFVEFEYKGKSMEIKTLGSSIATWKQIGEKVAVYYNEKIPGYVVIKGIREYLLYFVLIILGLFIFL